VSSTARAEPRPRLAPNASAAVRERGWEITVWSAMTLWTIVLFVVARDAYSSFRVGRFDLGNMVQAVWSTAHGRPLEMTAGATGEQMLRLGAHADPFLVLLAPVWLIWPSPLALALAQIAVVALGALPVFWLARRHCGSERVAGLLALGYLAYPWVATSAVAAIHPVTFAITFFLLCIWFLEIDRLALFGTCAVLAMSTGELMGLPILGLGIWFALARGRRCAGAVIAAGGVAWTLAAVYFVVPAFAGEHSLFYGFYDQIGGSPQGVLRTLGTHPGAVLGALLEPRDVAYLVWLGLPLLGLFVLAPGLAAVAIPQLLANGLSDFRSMTDPRYHSVAAAIPFLIAATVLGVARLRTSRQPVAAAGVLVCSATLALAVGPWGRAAGMTPLGGRETPSPARSEALRQAIAAVPQDAAVTTTNAAGARLSARTHVYSVPILGHADWAVVDLGDPWVVSERSPILTSHPEVVAAFVRRLRSSAGWREVRADDGVLVFRRLP